MGKLSFGKCVFTAVALFIASIAHGAEVTIGIDPAQNADGYRVYYGTDINNLMYSEDMGQQTSNYTIRKLDCNTEYHFAVKAYNENGSSGFTNTVSVTTGACPQQVIVPEGWNLDGLIVTPITP